MTPPDETSYDPKLPGMSDKAMISATGKGWSEWVELINAWPGSKDGHAAVASWLAESFPLDGWWAQGITVGWERLTGRRQLHQQADGTFSASTSRTFKFDFDLFKTRLHDDSERASLLGLDPTEVTSRPGSKSVRVKYEDTSILFDSYPGTSGRTRLLVAHERLTSPAQVQSWKSFWSTWIKALPES